jgi:hypothetical protein
VGLQQLQQLQQQQDSSSSKAKQHCGRDDSFIRFRERQLEAGACTTSQRQAAASAMSLSPASLPRPGPS